MAKVKLLNNREHDIFIHVPSTPQKPIEPIRVPGGRKQNDKFVPGQVQAEDSHIAEAKKNKVVQHYFKEGWLKQDNGAEKPKSEPTE
jgi:hypothetical protein